MSSPPSTPPLSAKAKGKQRAQPNDEGELDTAGSSTSDTPILRTFTVRFSEGFPDLELSVGPKDTVKQTIDRIRTLRPSLAQRRIRLIHSGRLLTNGTQLDGWLASLEQKQRRVLEAGSDGPIPSPSHSGVWVHCSVGPEIPDDEIEEESSVQTSQLTPLRGFDRLTTAGFTPEEVENVRRQFHRSRGGDFGPVADGALQEEEVVGADDEHARALEEQWIDNMDSANGILPEEPNESPLYPTLLQGILLGAFFPLLPLFFFRAPHFQFPAAFFSDEFENVEGPRSVVFSKRMSMAICLGLLVNVSLGVRWWFSV